MEPRPWQRGHAPCGELKENTRGASSASDTPCSGHAKRSEKTSGGCSASPSRGTTWISTRPSATVRAVSTESVSRRRRSSFITRRSTTTAMSCLNFLSSTMGSSSSRISPSMRARVKPSPRSVSSTSLNSPFLPRATGASTVKRVPSGSCMTCSTICSADCPAIGRPQIGQCGCPMRAKSRRR